MSNGDELLKNHLREHGHSVTSVRRQVFAVLNHEEPQSMKEIVGHLPTIDRASIYRTIALFEKLGIVHRLQFGWKYKLELTDTFSYHHHHISCTNCGVILPLREDTMIEAAIKSLAGEYGFMTTNHQLEIQGLCNKCQQAG